MSVLPVQNCRSVQNSLEIPDASCCHLKVAVDGNPGERMIYGGLHYVNNGTEIIVASVQHHMNCFGDGATPTSKIAIYNRDSFKQLPDEYLEESGFNSLAEMKQLWYPNEPKYFSLLIPFVPTNLLVTSDERFCYAINTLDFQVQSYKIHSKYNEVSKLVPYNSKRKSKSFKLYMNGHKADGTVSISLVFTVTSGLFVLLKIENDAQLFVEKLVFFTWKKKKLKFDKKHASTINTTNSVHELISDVCVSMDGTALLFLRMDFKLIICSSPLNSIITTFDLSSYLINDLRTEFDVGKKCFLLRRCSDKIFYACSVKGDLVSFEVQQESGNFGYVDVQNSKQDVYSDNSNNVTRKLNVLRKCNLFEDLPSERMDGTERDYHGYFEMHIDSYHRLYISKQNMSNSEIYVYQLTHNSSKPLSILGYQKGACEKDYIRALCVNPKGNECLVVQDYWSMTRVVGFSINSYLDITLKEQAKWKVLEVYEKEELIEMNIPLVLKDYLFGNL